MGIGIYWPHRLDLNNGYDGYIKSVGRALQSNLRSRYGSRLRGLTQQSIINDLHSINQYPNIDSLTYAPEKGQIIEIPSISVTRERARLAETVEAGIGFARHDAAGFGTRLGLGPKYFLTPEILIDAVKTSGKPEIISKLKALSRKLKLDTLLSISLGDRHMLQHSFNLTKLAKDTDRNPKMLLGSAVNMIVIGEASAEIRNHPIIEQFNNRRFYGFNRNNTYFFLQKAHHGFNFDPGEGRIYYDEQSPKCLYNHGSMFMEMFIDNGVFKVNESGGIESVEMKQYLDFLKRIEHMVSYNIADSQFLFSSFDYAGFTAALRISAEQNCRMIMEIVAPKIETEDHNKVGYWAHDNALKRSVIIESDLSGIPNGNLNELHEFFKSLAYLNRNFNHFVYPRYTIDALAEASLPLHPTEIDGYIYPQPPQGDINFLVPTAFMKRNNMAPIQSLKTINDIPDALEAMWKQDNQDGFRDFVRELEDF